MGEKWSQPLLSIGGFHCEEEAFHAERQWTAGTRARTCGDTGKCVDHNHWRSHRQQRRKNGERVWIAGMYAPHSDPRIHVIGHEE